MYDDLLGKRKRKEEEKPAAPKPNIDIGICDHCEFGLDSKIHRRSTDLYCTKIKKYVNRYMTSCLKFKRKTPSQVIERDPGYPGLPASGKQS